jgi:hypothetical protein
VAGTGNINIFKDPSDIPSQTNSYISREKAAATAQASFFVALCLCARKFEGGETGLAGWFHAEVAGIHRAIDDNWYCGPGICGT